MWIKAAGGRSAARRRRGGARGVQSSSPPGRARSGGQARQGPHSCVDRPAASQLWIETAGGRSAARRRLGGAEGARGVQGSSPPGRARSDGPGSHSRVDLPAAFRMLIQTAGGGNLARCARAELGSGSAKPLPSGPCPERQGSHACVDRPAARRLWFETDGGRSAARSRRSGARGVQSSSPQGRARSDGLGSHSQGDLPAACRMLIRTAGCSLSSAAHRARTARGSGSARQLPSGGVRAVLGAVGKGPTLEWTRLRPAGCRSRRLVARAPLVVGGEGLGECKHCKAES